MIPQTEATYRKNPPESGVVTPLRFVGSFVPLLLVAVAWLVSLQGVDLARINDLGLVSALPFTFFLALGVLTLNFCLLVHQRQAHPLLLFLNVFMLILILHGTPALLYETPRYSWTYKHIGLTGYIQQHGSIDPYIDAYLNWPGFFILSALFTDISGLKSSLDFAKWAPPFFNLLYLGALLLLFRIFTKDRRLVWLGIWFFYLTSWVGQDYFAPQALSYFFHLVVLGIFLKWYGEAPKLATAKYKLESLNSSQPGLSSAKPLQSVGLMAILVLVFCVIVASHQLTPFMTIASVVALVVFRRCRVYVLPLLMIILTISWSLYFATPYLAGHLPELIGSVGRLSKNLQAVSSGRAGVQSSSDRLLVLDTRKWLSVLVWTLAAFGAVRHSRYASWNLSYILLALVPFSMLALQSYGGEMLLRVYFFSLPFMVLFAAALLYPSFSSSKQWWIPVLSILLSGVLLTGFSLAYYGNERMNFFTQAEVDTLQYVYSHAPAGSLILTATFNSPLKLQGYGDYIHESFVGELQKENRVASDLETIMQLMTAKGYPAAYLVLTRSQKAYLSLVGILPVAEIDKLENALDRSNLFKPVLVTKDSRVYVLSDPRGTVSQ